MENIINEVVETTEEFVPEFVEVAKKSGKASRNLVIVGATILTAAVGYGAYRAGKYVVGKIKNKKASAEAENDEEESSVENNENEESNVTKIKNK